MSWPCARSGQQPVASSAAISVRIHRTRGQGSGTAQGHGGVHFQPSMVARIRHWQRQRPGWATSRPAPGHVRCAASRLVPRVVRRRADRRAGLRHGATLRLSGAGHREGPAPDGHPRCDASHPRAKPTVGERAALASGRCSWE